MTRPMRITVRLWPWLLALLVLAPTLAPGYVLSYDMVFVPDLALRSDFLGLGTSLPRAVPSDAVVAVLDEAVPGMLLQKVVLVAAMVLAGVGARRLVPRGSGFAQLGATSVYVWNPYVAERLGIGHWPLLLAYAALPWIIDAARRLRAGEARLVGLVLWLALAALSASGGVMAALVAVAFVAGASGPALRRTGVVALAAVVVNLPWLVTGALHGPGALTDPAGVEAFAARGAGPLPMPLTLLGLGGIWNREVVPLSLEGWAAGAWLVLLVLVCLVGARAWWAATPRRDVAAYGLCGAVGLVVAGWGAMAPESLAWFVSTLPGGGIVRDGARFVALLAPLEAALFGFGVGALARVSRERVANVALAAGAVLMPLAMMPDVAWGLGGALRPVDYPAEYAAARVRLQEASERADSGTGAVLVLPFTAYRAPAWNHGRRVLDPLGRYLPLDYVTSDDLYVDGRLVAGEDRRAARVKGALVRQSTAEPGPVLAREGISWVALDREARRALGRPVLTLPPGERLVFDGQQVVVWSLDRVAAVRGSGPARLLAVGAAWVVWSALVLLCLGLALVRGAGMARKGIGRRGRW